MVTPMIIASVEADHARTRGWTKALLSHLISDPTHGAANLDVITTWVTRWSAASRAACEAFRPVFEQAPVNPSTFDEALARVLAGQASALGELGITAGASVASKGEPRV
jgi:alkene monooxygenase beta subunit